MPSTPKVIQVGGGREASQQGFQAGGLKSVGVVPGAMQRVRVADRDTAAEGDCDLQAHTGVAGLAGEQLRDRRQAPEGSKKRQEVDGLGARCSPERSALTKEPFRASSVKVIMP